MLAVEDERRDAARSFGLLVGAGEEDERARLLAVGDELLRAGDAPAVSVRDGRRPQRAGVGARSRLGEREGADLLAARERRHEPLALLLGAEREDRQRAGARVHRHRDADAGVGARELLEHEDVGEEVGARAAELRGHADAQQPQLGELRVELRREAVLAVPGGGVRLDLGLRELSRERLDLPLVVRQGEVHRREVYAAARNSRRISCRTCSRSQKASTTSGSNCLPLCDDLVRQRASCAPCGRADGS